VDRAIEVRQVHGAGQFSMGPIHLRKYPSTPQEVKGVGGVGRKNQDCREGAQSR